MPSSPRRRAARISSSLRDACRGAGVWRTPGIIVKAGRRGERKVTIELLRQEYPWIPQIRRLEAGQDPDLEHQALVRNCGDRPSGDDHIGRRQGLLEAPAKKDGHPRR